MNGVTIGLKTGHSVPVDGQLAAIVRRYEEADESALLAFTLDDGSRHPDIKIRRDAIEYIADGGAL